MSDRREGGQRGRGRGSNSRGGNHDNYNNNNPRNNNASDSQDAQGWQSNNRGNHRGGSNQGSYRGDGYGNRGGYGYERDFQGGNRGYGSSRDNRGRGYSRNTEGDRYPRDNQRGRYSRDDRGGRGGGRGRNQQSDCLLDSFCDQFKSLQVHDPQRHKPFNYSNEMFKVDTIMHPPEIICPLLKPRDHHINKSPVSLITNYFSIPGFAPYKVWQFDVVITHVKPDGHTKDDNLTEQGQNKIEDVTKSKDRNIDRMNKDEKRSLITLFLNTLCEQLDIKPYHFVYDGGKTIYSNKSCDTFLDGGRSYSLDLIYQEDNYNVKMEGVMGYNMGFIMTYLKFHQDVKNIKSPSVMDDRNKNVSEQADKELTRFLKCFQILDVVLRHCLSSKLSCYGRSYFNLNGHSIKLFAGKHLYQGFFANVRFFFDAIAVNFDVANAVFVKQADLKDHLYTLGFNPQRLIQDSSEFNRANKAIKGIRIKLGHFKYPRFTKIRSLTHKTPRDHKFMIDEGTASREISVEQYYRERYNVVCDPNLPLIEGNKIGTYFPMDICEVPFTRCTGVIDENSTRDMIKATAQPPDNRKDLILQKFQELMPPSTDPYLTEWGLNIKPEMNVVQGYILPPPQLFYANNETACRHHMGSWNFSGRYYKSARGNRPYTYRILDISRLLQEQVVDFFGGTVNEAIKCGISIERNGEYEKATPENLVPTLHHILKNRNDQVSLLFVVGTGSSDAYATVKSIAELEYGVMTQFIKAATVQKSGHTVFVNVCHKLNAKFGGINVSLFNKTVSTFDGLKGMLFNTMLVGIDVTHGGGSSRLSIAAVVASMDSHPHLYEIRLSGQKHPKLNRQSIETVVDMKNIIIELLQAYIKRNNCMPERMFIYRDGVSEGQFKTVLNYEYNAINEAIQYLMRVDSNKLELKPLPLITYCVVQKRHHTRFFPTKGIQTTKKGNIMPGTLVDFGICMNTEFDFFLCSHEGIQGTSRPTYYRVLIDNNSMSRSSMAQLTHSLCFTYVRCTRSVSIVTPCYYAHLAAFRARHYVDFFTKIDEHFSDFVNDDKVPNSNSEKMEVVRIAVTPEISKVLFFV